MRARMLLGFWLGTFFRFATDMPGLAAERSARSNPSFSSRDSLLQFSSAISLKALNFSAFVELSVKNIDVPGKKLFARITFICR